MEEASLGEVFLHVDQLGALVRRARLSHGLTQVELAAASGVALNTIQKLEESKGNVTVPSLFAILQALGLDVKAVDRRQPSDQFQP